jgi:hypothetical protein
MSQHGAGYQSFDVWYKQTAEFIAAQVGGQPHNVEEWLRDGDALDMSLEELMEEWGALGCEYEFNQ